MASMGVEPFLFEPEYDDTELEGRQTPTSEPSDDERQETGAGGEPEGGRLNGTGWCTCKKCDVMKSEVECLCCRDREG
jgi:hypothetical protein